MFSDLLKHIGDLIGEFFSKDEVFWLLFFVVMTGGIAIVAVPDISLIQIILDIIHFFLRTWWFWLFLILFPLTQSLWLYFKQEEFKNGIKWILLELRIPRETDKSPRAMEQVFVAFHTLRNVPGDWREKYIDGEITRPISLEIVSLGGEIHFYIRTYAKQKNLVEASMFAYYPDVEVVEVDDYIDRLPKDLQETYEQGQNIWGTEMVLNKEEAYPIKSYAEFEDPEETRQFDPISTFLEVLGKVKKEEIAAIQMLIAPADKAWSDEWDSLLEELEKPKMIDVVSAEGDVRKVPVPKSPGKTDIIEKIENNFSKPAFATLIRFIYLSPQSSFSDTFASRGLVGAFNQYGSLEINSFRQNYNMSTRVDIWHWPHIFPKARNEYRKQRILFNYRKRELPPETWMGRFMSSHPFNLNFHSKRFILNIEGLASLFHPPIKMVLTAPHIKRLESRKAGPPAGLPIFGEEEEIKKYME